jgi:16S rRNA (uracil1498-N3)-methyltransferase
MPRFYCETPIRESASFELDSRAAQHVRVLRLREGEAIVLFDGSGGEVPTQLDRIDKKSVSVTTLQRLAIEREHSRAIMLLPALIANDRFDWLMQKATELGATTIQPIYSERSQRIPGDIDKRVDHWRGVAIAACEQSGRNRIPAIHGPISLHDAMKQSTTQMTILLDADGATSIDLSSSGEASGLAVFVGPEGGFSSEELSALRKRCDHKLRIGLTVLRAETAAVASLAVLASLT